MIAAPRIVEGNNINNNTREGWFTGFLLNYIYSTAKQNIIFYHFSRTALRYHPRRSVGSLCKSTLLLSFARSFGWIKLSMIERYRDYDQRIVIVAFYLFFIAFYLSYHLIRWSSELEYVRTNPTIVLLAKRFCQINFNPITEEKLYQFSSIFFFSSFSLCNNQ